MIDFDIIYVETTVNIRYPNINNPDDGDLSTNIHIKAKIENYNPIDLYQRYNDLFLCESIDTLSDVCYYIVKDIFERYRINEVTVSYYENNNKYSYEYFDKD